MARATSELWLPLQPQSITSHWTVAYYTAWQQRVRCEQPFHGHYARVERLSQTRDLVIVQSSNLYITISHYAAAAATTTTSLYRPSFQVNLGQPFPSSSPPPLVPDENV